MASTWQSGSTSSTTKSTASSLFGLDEHDGRARILVYRHRSGSRGLEVSTQRDLCRALDADPSLSSLRVARKHIPRGNSRLELRMLDLLPAAEAQKCADRPTLSASVANVGLPATAYWMRLLFNAFPDLYIVSRSPASSPSSSVLGTSRGAPHEARSPDSPEFVTPPRPTFRVDDDAADPVPRHDSD